MKAGCSYEKSNRKWNDQREGGQNGWREKQRIMGLYAGCLKDLSAVNYRTLFLF